MVYRSIDIDRMIMYNAPTYIGSRTITSFRQGWKFGNWYSDVYEKELVSRAKAEESHCSYYRQNSQNIIRSK